MNIRQKMIACGAISVLTATLLGGLGFWGQMRLAAALAENELSVSALRNHLEGDMMHDACVPTCWPPSISSPATAAQSARCAPTSTITASGSSAPCRTMPPCR
ncbi:hypothetical protein ACE3ME_08165 [Pseudomonas alcaligenes]|uniref:hypothetical protein n=1 Tax=Aquipseudomonas alcaligenes TaxID=43263 RepID=UPI003649B815